MMYDNTDSDDSTDTTTDGGATENNDSLTISQLTEQLLGGLETRLADEVACAIIDGYDGLDVTAVASNGHVDGHPKVELRCRAWGGTPPEADECAPLARVDFRDYHLKDLCRFIAQCGGDPR